MDADNPHTAWCFLDCPSGVRCDAGKFLGDFYSPESDTPTDGAQLTSDRSSLTTVDLGDVLLVKAAHYIAPKASVNSPRLSKVTGCRPSKRRDVYSFSILSISISFSILKFLSQSLLWICSSSFLLPLEYKSRSVLLPPIMCSSELVFQVSLTYCVRSHHQRRVRRLSCRWRR